LMRGPADEMGFRRQLLLSDGFWRAAWISSSSSSRCRCPGGQGGSGSKGVVWSSNPQCHGLSSAVRGAGRLSSFSGLQRVESKLAKAWLNRDPRRPGGQAPSSLAARAPSSTATRGRRRWGWGWPGVSAMERSRSARSPRAATRRNGGSGVLQGSRHGCTSPGGGVGGSRGEWAEAGVRQGRGQIEGGNNPPGRGSVLLSMVARGAASARINLRIRILIHQGQTPSGRNSRAASDSTARVASARRAHGRRTAG